MRPSKASRRVSRYLMLQPSPLKRMYALSSSLLIGLMLLALLPGSATASSLPASSHPDRMSAGMTLEPDQYLRSASGEDRLYMQADGNLVLLRKSSRVTGSFYPVWSTNTSGNPGARLQVQDDGNVVLVAPGERAIWSTNTQGNPGARLQIQVDGNVVVVAPGERAIWSTNTQRV